MTEEEYLLDLGVHKDARGLTWKDVAQLMNNEFVHLYSPDKYRKQFYQLLDEQQLQTGEPAENITQLAYNIKSAQISKRDQFNESVFNLRRLAREDTLKYISLQFAQIMKNNYSYNINEINLEEKDKVGILLLSDWHYGIEFDIGINRYNPDICKSRVEELLARTIQIINKEEIKQLYLLNLSDLISGRIHSQIRLSNRIDVISQIMEVSEILGQFINKLSKYVNIQYYACTDNHSRIEPNKKESLQLETLSRITHWYFKEIFKDNSNVSINDNEFSDDIIKLKIFNFNIAAVHGDKDPVNQVIKNLSGITNTSYDLICTAHNHHFYINEENNCMHVANSSLMGTDEFAESIRLSAKPSQVFIVMTEKDATNCIYKIQLN